MSAFNKVSEDAIKNVQVNAGMILKSFSPSSPTAPQSSDIVCITTGGITASCKPTTQDFGSDIDNCPANVKEMKRITEWVCTLSFTALDISASNIKLALGAASSISSGAEIVPRTEIAGADFSDIWFVSEKVNDTAIAICLKNALSTGGFALKTGKDSKGQLTVELTGHVSLTNTDKVPMEFYIVDISDIDDSTSGTVSSGSSSSSGTSGS